LVEKYGKKGFLAVGVTSEPEDPTAKYMEETGAKMAVAYETSSKSMEAYGFRGYPSAALIDPKGILVWKGHPSRLTDEIIEQHIKGAVVGSGDGKLALELELPKKYAAVAKQLAKGDLGDAHKALAAALAGNGVAEADRPALEAAKAEVEATLAAAQHDAQTAATEERWFDAQGAWKRVSAAFRNHEAGKAADAAAAEIAKDPARKKELEAGQKIADALKLAAAGKAKEALSALDALSNGVLKDTKEAARAKALAEQMRKDG